MRKRQARGGFTFLEVQVAFVMLGIGLAGLCPLVAMQLRVSRLLARSGATSRESFTLNTYRTPAPPLVPATTYLWPHPFDPENPDRVYFLVPEANPWYRRFGHPATLQMDPPAPPSAPNSPPPNKVVFTGPPVLNGDSVTVGVKVTPQLSGSGS